MLRRNSLASGSAVFFDSSTLDCSFSPLNSPSFFRTFCSVSVSFTVPLFFLRKTTLVVNNALYFFLNPLIFLFRPFSHLQLLYHLRVAPALYVLHLLGLAPPEFSVRSVHPSSRFHQTAPPLAFFLPSIGAREQVR